MLKQGHMNGTTSDRMIFYLNHYSLFDETISLEAGLRLRWFTSTFINVLDNETIM